jgi:hypothetical protein
LPFEIRPVKDINFDFLVDGRLEKYDIQVNSGQSTAVLTVANGGTLIANRVGLSTHFEFRHRAYPQRMFDALSKEFDTELVAGDDFRFWGFSSHAEMLATCKVIDDIEVRSSELGGVHWLLVEGPGCGDAEFTCQWIQSAIDADRLLKQQFSGDLSFRPNIDRREVARLIEFGPAAMAFVGMWLSQVGTFSLDLLDCEWAEMFCVMALVGFFTQTGERYQMTVPKDLKAERIRDALIRLAETEDTGQYVHPEKLLNPMTLKQMFVWKERLDRMTSQNRLADRDSLLGE